MSFSPKAFSSEVGTTSRRENATKQNGRVIFRFNRIGKCSKSFQGVKAASSFETTLEAVENAAEPTVISGELSHLNNPFGSLSAPLGANGDPGSQGRWEMLYEETEKDGLQESSPRPLPLQKPSAEALARELKLYSVRGASALLKLRREFMWRNHPDRRPEVPREWANARVAIVNMLIDQALREASKKKKASR